jgi:hypothetical protein
MGASQRDESKKMRRGYFFAPLGGLRSGERGNSSFTPTGNRILTMEIGFSRICGSFSGLEPQMELP